MLLEELANIEINSAETFENAMDIINEIQEEASNEEEFMKALEESFAGIQEFLVSRGRFKDEVETKFNEFKQAIIDDYKSQGDVFITEIEKIYQDMVILLKSLEDESANPEEVFAQANDIKKGLIAYIENF